MSLEVFLAAHCFKLLLAEYILNVHLNKVITEHTGRYSIIAAPTFFSYKRHLLPCYPSH